MVETADVTTTPAANGAEAVDDVELGELVVRVIGAPRFTANQLRQIQAATGLSVEAIMGDATSVMQAYAYTRLRLDGHPVSWDQAGDVYIEYGDATPDPTSTDNATASPRSVGSGE